MSYPSQANCDVSTGPPSTSLEHSTPEPFAMFGCWQQNRPRSLSNATGQSLARCQRLTSVGLPADGRNAPGISIVEGFNGRAAFDRSLEHALGRSYLRAALQRLGVAGSVTSSRSDGSPSVPSGYVGSLSHRMGYIVAGAARVETCIGIGIDIELERRVLLEPELFLEPRELAWLDCLQRNQDVDWITLYFSAKESLFKLSSSLPTSWPSLEGSPLMVSPEGSIDILLSPSGDRTLRDVDLSGCWSRSQRGGDSVVQTRFTAAFR